MIARAFCEAGLGRWLGASLTLALPLIGCTRVPLTAPTKSIIAIYATAASVPVNGSVDVIATVTEEAGTPVQDGTLVSFTTTLGRLEPSQARTTAGQVTVKLVADGQSGTATVSAFSGGATAAPVSGSTTGTAAATLTIPIGGAAADSIVVSAQPAGVPRTGGTVQIIAQVRDASGNTLGGVPVTFTTTAGQIQTPTVTTNASGEAQTAFTTTSKATVTAHAGAKTATVDVDITALPSITISANPASPIAGQPVTFNLTIDATTGLNPVRSVRIAYGDGDFEDLGVITGSTTATHIYGSDGSRTVTVTVTDTTGQQVTQSLVIVVLPKVPVAVALAIAPSPGVVNEVVTFVANVTGTTVAITSYDWDFGDGSTRTTTGNSTTKIYAATGTFHATVTVHAQDGSTGVGAADLLIGS
jgi:PKD repeat protein